MGLVRLAKNFIDGRKPLPLEPFLKSIPVRNALIESEEDDQGGIVLKTPLSPGGKGLLSSIAKATKMPDVKRIELEPIGAFVWRLCDGKHTFEGISTKLREKYKLKRVEADTALGAFLHMLAQRKLITLMVKGQK